MTRPSNPAAAHVIQQEATASAAVGAIRVSVIIPAYNAARTLLRAIDSVRLQHVDYIEVIVIDDGSSDDTAKVLLSNIRAGEQIRLITLSRNSGVSAARNAGIRQARGKYLAFLDADDIWLSGKLQQQIDAMQSDSEVVLVSCNSRLVSEQGELLKFGHLNRPPAEGRDAWKTLLVYNFLPTPTILTYRNLVIDIGGFDETLTIAEDLDLWIKLALRGKVAIIKEVLTHYYDSPGSLMKRYSAETRSLLAPMLEKHLQAQAGRLTRLEQRQIRGRQAFNIACDLYFSGTYLRSIGVFLKAARHGVRPFKSLAYLPRALFMALLGNVMHRNKQASQVKC